MHGFFLDLTLLIVAASVFSIIFRLFKQPPVLAYILTGVIGAYLMLVNNTNKEDLRSLSEIGITLLLFVLGIEMKLDNLKSVGKVALFTGIGQIVFTTFFGFFICLALGFDNLTSIFVAFAITFSSTIVIVKLLSDKRDLNSLYGKISVGFLLVQDFCAILALIFLTTLAGGAQLDLINILLVLLKAALLLVVTVLMGKYIFPALVHNLSRNQEILFISSLAWAFGFAALVSSPIIGFSIEIGGFLAGLALANSIESSQIITKVRALRDFFIVIFFVILGSGMAIGGLGDIIVPSVLLSLFILIGNPLIVMVILGLFGYSSRTGFLSGLAVAQISEFSLILIFLGQKMGHISDEVVSIVTLVGIITFTISTYMILNGEKIYKLLKPILRIFQKKKTVESKMNLEKGLKNHFILVGADRMGMRVLKSLKKDPSEVLVIDFNPDIVKSLDEQGFNAIFGDIADIEIEELANIAESSFILSTVPDFEDNLNLIKNVRSINKKVTITVTAHTEKDKEDLLAAGANHVIMPYTMAAKAVARALNSDKLHLLS